MAGVESQWTRPQRVVAAGLLAAIMLATVVNGYRSVVVHQHGFHLFDWLVSYDGGFVRRGLAGQAVLWLDRHAHLDASLMVLVLQLVAYALILHGAYSLAVRSVPTPALVLMLVSPAVFTFHLYDVAGGYRKEILGIALVAQLYTWSRRTDRDQVRFRLLTACLAAMVPLVLVSELTVVFVPYLLLVAIDVDWTRPRLVVAGVLVMGVAVGLLGAVVSSGSASHVADICARLRETLPPSPRLADCETGTAVAWLANPTSVATAAVGEYARGMGRTLGQVLPLVALGFVPVLSETVGQVERRRRRWTVAVVGASLLAWAPLFAVALDWGRLVYMQAAGLTLLALYLRSSPVRPNRVGRRPTLALVAAVPVYATLWNLHHANDLLGNGIVGLFGVGS